MPNAPGAQHLLAPDSALPEIPYKGTLYKVGRPDGNARARLEKLVKKVALDGVRALKGVLDAAAYKEAFANVADNLKRYDTWREGWQAIVFDPGCKHLFLWSLLLEHQPAISEQQVLELAEAVPEEVHAALAQVLPAFFQTLLSALLPLLPEEKRPEAEAKFGEALATLRASLTPTPASTST